MKRAKLLTITFGVLLLAGVTLMLLSRGYFGPPVITVVNDSGSTITGLVLGGDGFSVSLPDVVPGDSVTTIVHASGESSMKIDFQLEDRVVTKDDLTYIESEGGYVTIITVQKNGQIECHSGFGFRWRRAI
jgi:hypothetical protein